MTRGQPLVFFSLKPSILSLSLYLSRFLRACISCSTASCSFAHVPVDFLNFPFFFPFSPTPLDLYPCIYRIPIPIYFIIYCVSVYFSLVHAVALTASSPRPCTHEEMSRSTQTTLTHIRVNTYDLQRLLGSEQVHSFI